MTVHALIASLLITAASGEHIAYISVDPQGATSLQLVNTATNESRLIAEDPALETPAWSPDGTTLAWVDDVDGGIRLWAAGTNEARTLLDSGGRSANLRWFPGGMSIVATTFPSAEAPPRIDVVEADSGKVETWGGEMGRNVGGLVIQGLLQAEWLSSGRLILALDPEEKLEIEGVDMDVLREEGGITEEALREDLPPRALLALALVIVEGRLTTEPVLLTRTQVLPILLLPEISEAGDSLRFNEWNITANQDGDRVALESNLGGDREIFVISRTGLSNVSNHHAADQNPVWGEERRVLLFESFRAGRRGVYSAIADTARVTSLAGGHTFDAWSPAWSVDGKSVAYVSNESGTPEIYTDVPEGGEAVQRTVHPPGGMALAPAWRPEGEE